MKNQNSINELEFVIDSIVNAGINNTIISKGFAETFQGLEQSKLINLDEIIQKILVNKIGDIKTFINNKNNTTDNNTTNNNTIDKNSIYGIRDIDKLGIFGSILKFNCCDECKHNEECNLPNKGDLSYCEEFENYSSCDDCENYDNCTLPSKDPKSTKSTKSTNDSKDTKQESKDDKIKKDLGALKHLIGEFLHVSLNDTKTTKHTKNTKSEEKQEEAKNEKTSITGNADTDSFFQDVLNGTSTEYFVLPVNELENFKKLQTAIKVLKLNLNVSDLYKVQNGVFYFNTPKGKNSFDTKRVNFNNN